MAKSKKEEAKSFLDKAVKKVSKTSQSSLQRRGSSEYKKLVLLGKVKE